MYEQKRTEVNKAAEKYEKQIKAAKRSGNKANQVNRKSCAVFLSSRRCSVFADSGAFSRCNDVPPSRPFWAFSADPNRCAA